MHGCLNDVASVRPKTQNTASAYVGNLLPRGPLRCIVRVRPFVALFVQGCWFGLSSANSAAQVGLSRLPMMIMSVGLTWSGFADLVIGGRTPLAMARAVRHGLY